MVYSNINENLAMIEFKQQFSKLVRKAILFRSFMNVCIGLKSFLVIEAD